MEYAEKLFLNFFSVGILKINDENNGIRIPIRIHWSEAWIRGSTKCHGSPTLLYLTFFNCPSFRLGYGISIGKKYGTYRR